MAIKKSQLYSKLWEACDELRGGMDASQYKDYVLVVLFIKYLSDKKKSGDKSLLIELPKGCSFDDLVLLKGSKDIGEKMNVILGRIAEANDLEGVVNNADFADETKLGKGKDLVDTVSGLIGVFQDEDLDFSNNRAADDDLIGDAYEYLMKNFATQSGKSKGQFYTPAEVSRVMAKVIGIGDDKRKMISIYDPTCGSGSLLLRAAAEAKGAVAIQGQEKDVATIGMARMSMVVHGVDDPDLRHGDTLTDPLHKRNDRELCTFDYVVANPPFSVKSWLKGASEEDPFGRWGHGEGVAPVPPLKCGDYAFLLHILKSMKPSGHAAVILPHGVLFRGNAEAEIRKFIVRRHWIKGIIGLPPNLFFGTGIPACVIVLDKEGAAASKGIFMIDAKEGFAKDGAKNRLRESDVRRIVDVWNAGENVPHYAQFVKYADIEANDYNLNIPRYVAPADKDVRQDLTAHLNGGIPAEEAAKYPACLFKPLRRGFVTLALPQEDIVEELREGDEMADQIEAFESACAGWLGDFTRKALGLKRGAEPKKIIAEWGEELLRARASLVTPYALYEHLMNYWAETMQDDCYLICRDGWLARLVKPKKKSSGWRDLQCDLLPPEVVAKERCAGIYENYLKRVEELESLESQYAELTEGLGEDDEIPEEAEKLKKSISLFKKDLREDDKRFAWEIERVYEKLAEDGIKDLVIHHKWVEELHRRFDAELDRTFSQIAAEVKALADRYDRPLASLEADVAALREKVMSHLAGMGVGVKGAQQ
ncbi:MAG: N-6 DNA methylase [Kiritimatiellae bacterium]|nr:N-6 DNA methylase [Kiritimatiellia bacterium]